MKQWLCVTHLRSLLSKHLDWTIHNTTHTENIVVIGLDQESSYWLSNCKSHKLSFQVSKTELRWKFYMRSKLKLKIKKTLNLHKRWWRCNFLHWKNFLDNLCPLVLSWNIDAKVPTFLKHSMARLNSTKFLNDLPINNFQLDDISSKKNISTFFDKAKNKWFYEKNDGKKGYGIIRAFIIVYNWGFIPLVTMLFVMK